MRSRVRHFHKCEQHIRARPKCPNVSPAAHTPLLCHIATHAALMSQGVSYGLFYTALSPLFLCCAVTHGLLLLKFSFLRVSVLAHNIAIFLPTLAFHYIIRFPLLLLLCLVQLPSLARTTCGLASCFLRIAARKAGVRKVGRWYKQFQALRYIPLPHFGHQDDKVLETQSNAPTIPKQVRTAPGARTWLASAAAMLLPVRGNGLRISITPECWTCGHPWQLPVLLLMAGGACLLVLRTLPLFLRLSKKTQRDRASDQTPPRDLTLWLSDAQFTGQLCRCIRTKTRCVKSILAELQQQIPSLAVLSFNPSQLRFDGNIYHTSLPFVRDSFTLRIVHGLRGGMLTCPSDVVPRLMPAPSLPTLCTPMGVLVRLIGVAPRPSVPESTHDRPAPSTSGSSSSSGPVAAPASVPLSIKIERLLLALPAQCEFQCVFRGPGDQRTALAHIVSTVCERSSVDGLTTDLKSLSMDPSLVVPEVNALLRKHGMPVTAVEPVHGGHAKAQNIFACILQWRRANQLSIFQQAADHNCHTTSLPIPIVAAILLWFEHMFAHQPHALASASWITMLRDLARISGLLLPDELPFLPFSDEFRKHVVRHVITSSPLPFLADSSTPWKVTPSQSWVNNTSASFLQFLCDKPGAWGRFLTELRYRSTLICEFRAQMHENVSSAALQLSAATLVPLHDMLAQCTSLAIEPMELVTLQEITSDKQFTLHGSISSCQYTPRFCD